ncbi:class I SAM-dependent methyltransferase [Anaeromicropila herbilytica]|uniref:Methyltransferase n=1 Tax=Anaeromicropila herbilytica TaxID=2785025 RepID=A0A7R7EPQ6_9FIRM|nr:class I SAM-dependent methyltransferase [Anaeromicropila herbilytica]BCN32521.1 methyltransferase [Anaeromicropila herbilytica]
MNEKALDFYKEMAETSCSQSSVKLAKNSDFTDIDSKFIMQYTNKNSEILDLGSGTGLIINKIYNNVKSILAVEPFKQFSDFIVNSPNVEIINSNFFEWNTDKMFDIITLFGVVHYLEENEVKIIYEKFKKNLRLGGKLIIKSQFGLEEDVTISGFSEELQKDYFAQYRYIENEQRLLERIGYKIESVNDIYPTECNRWENTHFFSIVAVV